MKALKKILFCLGLALAFATPASAATFGDFTTTGKAFILFNAKEQKVLAEENADEKLPIASLTKIMATITILEDSELKLDDSITITTNMLKNLQGWAVVGLKVGDTLTVEELLYAFLLPSAGDAGQALAITDAGSIEEFSAKMNKKAETLGLTNSHFSNPIGRDEDNYSTARDLATLLFHALENPDFKKIFSTNTYYLAPLNTTIKKTTLGYGADASILSGAKTGFTYEAGRCLASTASLESTDYLLVTLGHDYRGANHIGDSIRIYNYYNDNFSYREILTKSQNLIEIPIIDSEVQSAPIVAPESFSYFMENSYDLKNLEISLSHPESINRYFDQTSEVAHLSIKKDDEVIYETPIYLKESIEFNNHIPLIIILIIGTISISLLCYHVFHKKLITAIVFMVLALLSGIYISHFYILNEPAFIMTVVE